MAFLVATTSLPAVYRPNDDARTTTAGMPHARAKIQKLYLKMLWLPTERSVGAGRGKIEYFLNLSLTWYSNN